MDSLLTLSLGGYRTVELLLRLTVALTGMAGLLMALSAGTLPPKRRIILLLPAVALGGAAWFESGVWLSWREAFELAGSSYAVTGQLLGDEDRIIAWSLAVPPLLLAFGMVSMPWGKAGGFRLERLAGTVAALALLAPFSRVVELALVAYAFHLLLRQSPAGTSSPSTLVTETRVALGAVAFGILIMLLGSWHLLPLGREAETRLVRGEIFRALGDLVGLCLPAAALLVGLLRLPGEPLVPAAEPPLPAKDLTTKERKPRTRSPGTPDLQSGLFGS